MKKVNIFIIPSSTSTYVGKAVYCFVDSRIKRAYRANSRGRMRSLHSAAPRSGRPAVVFVSNAHIGPIIEALLFASGEKWLNFEYEYLNPKQCLMCKFEFMLLWLISIRVHQRLSAVNEQNRLIRGENNEKFDLKLKKQSQFVKGRNELIYLYEKGL